MFDPNKKTDKLSNLIEKTSQKGFGSVRHSRTSLAKSLQNDDKKDPKSRLLKLVIFTSTFMIVEFVGGYWSNSVAVISDALHMGCDTVGYAVQLISVILATWKPTNIYTFGFKRVEVLGGLFNCVVIWILTIFLIGEAILRIIKPPVYFDAKVMLFTATLGVLLNLTMGGMLVGFAHIHKIANFWDSEPDKNGEEDEDYSIRITIAHIRADMGYSVGVLLSSVLIVIFPGWEILDSLCTIIFSYVVFHITQPIVVSVTRFILEGVPDGYLNRL